MTKLDRRRSFWLLCLLLAGLSIANSNAAGQTGAAKNIQNDVATVLKVEFADKHFFQIPVVGRAKKVSLPTPSPNIVAAIDDHGRPLRILFNKDASEVTLLLPGGLPVPSLVNLVVAEKSVQLSDGKIILSALDAAVHGKTAKLESHPGNHRIGFWTDPSDSVSWSFVPSRWGRYRVDLVYSLAGKGDSEIEIAINPGRTKLELKNPDFDRATSILTAKLKPTGSWYHYQTATIGVHYFNDATYQVIHQVKVACKQKLGGAVMNLKAVLLTPISEGTQPVRANIDGELVFESKDATVIGTRLVYEPNPKKLTLGWWARESDKARWAFSNKNPGRYSVQILQGCGKGQGGSAVAIDLLPRFATTIEPSVNNPVQGLEFQVIDTGHFQNFKWRTVGEMELPAGEFTLQVRPIKKAKNAVMDLRQIKLVPAH